MIMNRAKAVWTLHGANILGECWGHEYEVFMISPTHVLDPTITLYHILFSSQVLLSPPLSPSLLPIGAALGLGTVLDGTCLLHILI